MSKILASRLDWCRNAYDLAFRDLVSNMRSRMRKRTDAGTEEMELAIKYLPEELEQFMLSGPTKFEVEQSRWAEFMVIDWIDSKNKMRILYDAFGLLRQEERNAIETWKN